METQREVLLLPWFLAMFATIYILARTLIFKSWSPESRPEASSCLISLAHGTPALILAATALTSNPQTETLTLASSFSSPNTRLQNTALDYSIAYFVTDLAHFLLVGDGLLFVAHHLAVLFVFLTCRHAVDAGAAAVLALLLLAELTSLCQNLWTLAGARRNDRLRRFISVPFFVLYTVARGIAGPLLLFRMAVYYSSGAADGVIPRWLWLSWIAVVAAAISVSILWIGNLWFEFFRETRTKLQNKVS